MKTPFTTQQEHGLFTLKETSIVLPKLLEWGIVMKESTGRA